MTSFIFNAADLSDTDRLAAALAEVLPPGTTIALCGTLGAGKTRLVEGLAAACGTPRDDVVSPTFVLCQQYHGSRTIHHLDAYRLADEDEFWELGPEEFFESDGLTIIEWADRIPAAMPPDHLVIRIEVTGETTRRFEIDAVGQQLPPVIEELKKRILA